MLKLIKKITMVLLLSNLQITAYPHTYIDWIYEEMERIEALTDQQQTPDDWQKLMDDYYCYAEILDLLEDSKK